MNKVDAIDLGVAATVIAIIWFASGYGASEAFGAHPFWAKRVMQVGALAGGVLLPLLVWLPGSWRWKTLAALVLVVLAGLAAWVGKMRFAASFAEDALAGRAWFFGWIGLVTGLVLFFSLIIARAIRR